MNQIELYRSQDGMIELQVSFDNDTVWLNRAQLADLFGRDIKTIGKHINNLFEEGELDPRATVAKNAIVQMDGNILINRDVEYYNLDVVISVCYRVNSKLGTQFRQWATKRLHGYLVRGVAVNERRLQQLQRTFCFQSSAFTSLLSSST